MYAHGPLRHCHGTSEFSMISDLDRQRGEAMLQTEGTHADSQKLMGEYDCALTDRDSDATRLTSWFAWFSIGKRLSTKGELSAIMLTQQSRSPPPKNGTPFLV
jgi:hypothetical protein